MRDLLLAAMLGLLAVQPAVAQGQAAPPAAVGPRLTIDGVVPDADTGTLTISGANFGPRPFVTLDLVPLNLQLVIEARVVAVAPLAMMPPGTYLLTVARGPRTGESASFEVRLGPAPPSTATGSTASDPKVRDGARALELLQPLLQSERSLDLGETYAMALAETGQFREAQAIQRELTTAATRAGLTATRRRLEQRQALYDRADPCRTTWTEEEMP